MMFESQSPSLWQFDAERREEGTLELFPRKTPMWDGGDRWSLLGCITPTERDVPCAPQAIGQQWVRVLRLGRPLLSGRLAEAMGRWDEQTREAVVLAAVWERMRYESLD
ncbi:MAG TPA: hypothetical protein VHC70_01310 [Phycisphaerales bacterium]|nr:hypothetical protein [Phycisphaerales bacterium]